jgi:hypothetical protein
MLDKTFALLALLPDFADREHAHETGMYVEAVEEVKLLRALPEIVMLAGSARFKQSFESVAERLALQGKIVFGKHVFKPGDEWPLSEPEKDMIHAVQFRMCDLANRLHVVNVDSYIGQDTYNLIRYALRIERPVTFLEDRVRLLHKEGETITTHYFLQATRRRVEFDEATVS